MRKLFIILLINVTMACLGQSLTYDTKTYQGGYTIKVIQPTIENFIKLCNMSGAEFKSAMEDYNYFATDSSNGNYLEYWNGSLDNFGYAHAVNTFFYECNSGWIGYMVAKEYIYPNDSMMTFLSSLQPYSYGRKNVIYNDVDSDIYKIVRNGHPYGFFVSDLGTLYHVQVNIFAN